MKIYAYYFKTESCDEFLVMSQTKYKDAIDFMRNELDEYNAWKEEDYKDEDIPYCTFLMNEFDTEILKDKIIERG